MEDCGCTPGSSWKAPLRKALNEIAGIIDQSYDNEISRITSDPWSLRDEYIQVMLGKMTILEFAKNFTEKDPDPSKNRWLKALMESQVARQKMFTSCGWFFDELGRIEPKNNIGYAAQSILLVEYAAKKDLAEKAGALLKNVVSTRFNINGQAIFNEYYERAKKNLSVYFNESSGS
jgi:hypothetical protein